MEKLKEKNIKIVLSTIMCCIMLIVAIVNSYYGLDVQLENNTITAHMGSTKAENGEFIYLSDIDYIENQSSTGWGSILKDKTSNNTKITVKIDGVSNSFDKGMWAHATSVLVYDLSNYHYDYFTTLLGLNTTSTAGNGVTFRIYTSEDGTNYKLEYEVAKLPQASADFVKINIQGKKYLKLEAYDNKGNGQDHSVYADAKLTKASYEEALDIINLEEYNEKIRNYGTIDFNNPEHELAVLQRALIKNAGEFTIKRYIGESSENKEAFGWLFQNLENLRLYTMGGKPTGSYYNSFQQLKRLFDAYKSDFEIQEKTKYGFGHTKHKVTL